LNGEKKIIIKKNVINHFFPLELVANQNYYSKSTIQIYDRYGNLLKQVSALGQGWDGKFNGIDVPSDDYWYVIKLKDTSIVKGHFTLKR
jgi:gliding motility-associated-like protein